MTRARSSRSRAKVVRRGIVTYKDGPDLAFVDDEGIWGRSAKIMDRGQYGACVCFDAVSGWRSAEQ
jgi:hypothetical protein